MDNSDLPEGDRTQTITDRPGGSSPTDKSYDLAGQAMKARLAKRMFGVENLPPTIGRYRIVRKIGAGGMGVVHEGHDAELNRRVAIKLLHPELDDRHRHRMRREAQALARLSHPNVVHAYEIGEHEGALYLVMEFIEGVQLSKWQRELRGEWQVILEKYIEAGRGLAAAHDAGIVHRDFKPSNCVVCTDGPVRVLDFGLAHSSTAKTVADEGRLPDDVPVLEARVTITGTTMGTPAYMSPEQMLGQPTDAASDQYSYCVALYEALYGERPFAGERAAELYEALLFEKVNDPPADARVPTWLRAVLLKGLKAKPQHRFASMTELLTALEPPRATKRWQPAIAVVAVGGMAAAWSFAATDEACKEGASGCGHSLERGAEGGRVRCVRPKRRARPRARGEARRRAPRPIHDELGRAIRRCLLAARPAGRAPHDRVHGRVTRRAVHPRRASVGGRPRGCRARLRARRGAAAPG